jgi:hypothetical protein
VTRWETRQSLAAAEFLKGLATRIGGLPASAAKLGTALRAGGFPNPTITDAQRTEVVYDYLSSGSPDADWLRQQAGFTDDDLSQLAGLFATADELDAGPRPVLDTFDHTDLADKTVAMVSATTARPH